MIENLSQTMYSGSKGLITPPDAVTTHHELPRRGSGGHSGNGSR